MPAARGEQARIAVCGTGRRKELTTLLDEIRAAGAQTILLTGDLCDPEVSARLVEAALEFCGGLDALVSNAGVGKPAPMLDTTVADWDFQLDLHARAAWLLAKAAHPALKPEDVAGVIAFLLGPDAAFVTGENILIDGGLVSATLNQLKRAV